MELAMDRRCERAALREVAHHMQTGASVPNLTPAELAEARIRFLSIVFERAEVA